MTAPEHRWADEQFVSLTTFRKSGVPVATAVWIVAEPGTDRLLVWTPADSGKVKRLRHTPRATIQPCDRRGRVAADAVSADVDVRILADAADLEKTQALLAAKYGIEYRVVRLVETLVGAVRRRSTTRVSLELTVTRR